MMSPGFVSQTFTGSVVLSNDMKIKKNIKLSAPLKPLSVEEKDDNHLCLLSSASWEHRRVIKRKTFLTKNGSEGRHWIHLYLNKP